MSLSLFSTSFGLSFVMLGQQTIHFSRAAHPPYHPHALLLLRESHSVSDCHPRGVQQCGLRRRCCSLTNRSCWTPWTSRAYIGIMSSSSSSSSYAHLHLRATFIHSLSLTSIWAEHKVCGGVTQRRHSLALKDGLKAVLLHGCLLEGRRKDSKKSTFINLHFFII